MIISRRYNLSSSTMIMVITIIAVGERAEMVTKKEKSRNIE